MAYGGRESSVSVECCIRGYHVYQRMWNPELGDRRHHGSRTYSKYRRKHVLIVSLRASQMLIMRHKQAFCGGIFSNFASPE